MTDLAPSTDAEAAELLDRVLAAMDVPAEMRGTADHLRDARLVIASAQLYGLDPVEDLGKLRELALREIRRRTREIAKLQTAYDRRTLLFLTVRALPSPPSYAEIGRHSDQTSEAVRVAVNAGRKRLRPDLTLD
jgi:hypothetical protein